MQAAAPRGQEQARQASDFFADGPMPRLAVSSDLSRARHIAGILGFPDARTDRRLREMNLGEWTGQLIAGIEASEKSAYRTSRLGAYALPRGESWTQFRGRVDAGLRQVPAESLGDAVVTHEGVMRAACAAILVGPPPASPSPIAPAAITIFDIDQSTMRQKARLAAFNFAPNPGDLLSRGLAHAPV